MKPSSLSRREKLLLGLLTSTLVFSASFSYGAVSQSKVDSIMKMITDGGAKFSDIPVSGQTKSERTSYYEKVDAGLGDAVEMLATVRNNIRSLMGLSPAYTAEDIVGSILGGVMNGVGGANGDGGNNNGSNGGLSTTGKSCAPSSEVFIPSILPHGLDMGVIRIAMDNTCRTQVFRCNNGTIEKVGAEGRSCPTNPRIPFPGYTPPVAQSCKTNPKLTVKTAYSDTFFDFEYAGGIYGDNPNYPMEPLHGTPDGMNPDDFGKYQVSKGKLPNGTIIVSPITFRTVAISRVPDQYTRIALGVDPKINRGELFPEVKWDQQTRKEKIDSGIFSEYMDSGLNAWNLIAFSSGKTMALSRCPGDIGDLGNRDTIVLSSTKREVPDPTKADGAFGTPNFVSIDKNQPLTMAMRTVQPTYKNNDPTVWGLSNSTNDRPISAWNAQFYALPGLYTDTIWYRNYGGHGDCAPSSSTVWGCIFKREGGSAGSRYGPMGPL